MKYRPLFALLMLACTLSATGKDVVWYSGKGSVGYMYSGKKSAVVEMALHLFAEDMHLLTGRRAEARMGAPIEIYELDKLKDKDFRKLQKRKLPIQQVIAKPDAFSICTDGGRVVVLGSNAHGTAYGILELSRLAGVSPWVWWGDVHPARKHYLALADDFLTIQWPSVARRALVVTGKQFDRRRTEELLLRLRGNELLHEAPHGAGVKCLQLTDQWLPSTQPGRVFAEMASAYRQGASQTWAAVVANPKVSAYPLSLMMDMAWNINYVTASNLYDHYREWLCQQIGDVAGAKLLPVMTEYYHLVGIRKPEEMNVEFVADAFGNELERYISNYEDLVQAIDPITPLVATERADAYFAAVQYPLQAAKLMAVKQLQAQEARHIGRPQSFARDEEALSSAVKSWNAHLQLNRLNSQWDKMAGGKWEHTLAIADNALITGEPKFPGKLPKDALTTYAHPEPVVFNFDTGNTVTRNACQFRKASDGVTPIPMLGHSMRAVYVPEGGWLSYSFYSELQGEAVIRIAAIPMQSTDGSEVSFQVTIDDGEPQTFTANSPTTSVQWQTDMQRGQTVKEIAVRLTRNSHNIEIKALGSPVIIDQVMVDYDPIRPFYIFPVSPSLP